MTKDDAISRLKKQIQSIDELRQFNEEKPEFIKWQRDTEVLIENVFGVDKRNIKDFQNIEYSPSAWISGMPDHFFHESFIKGLDNAKAILNSFIEEIEAYWPYKINLEPELHTEESTQIQSIADVDSIWGDISKNFDVNKRSFAKKINFVSDHFKKNLIFRDIAHAYYFAHNGFTKPAVILSGSVIEELLRIYLNHNNIKINSNRFEDYIKQCVDNGLLKSAISKLSDSVRHFRNLVHLECEKSQRHTISKATAIGSVTSIFTVANDFS